MEHHRIELHEATSSSAWNQALALAPACVWQQSWAYGAAAAHHGRRVARLDLVERGRSLGVVQLLGRTMLGGRAGFWHALGGPVWRPDTPAAARTAAIRALRRHYGGPGRLLVVTPAEDLAATSPIMAAARMYRAMTGYTTAHLALQADADAQLRACNHGWRYELKRPPTDVSFELVAPGADPLALAEALGRHEASRRVRGYEVAATPVVAKAAQHGRALLASARHDGELAAFMLFVLHGRTATYQLGWTGHEGRARRAHRHVLWHALPALREAGCSLLDLGGLNLPAGIVAFKLGTGATPVTLAGSFV